MKKYSLVSIIIILLCQEICSQNLIIDPGFEVGYTNCYDGIPVSEIIKLQQKKIEELTLYLLEQEEKIKKLQEAMEKLIDK